jgi:uncharacterized protein (TIGR03086 family)
MDYTDALEMSWKHGANLIAEVRPADFSAPTPCTGWDVRALLNHVLGEATMMTEVNRGKTSEPFHADLVGDGTGIVATWESLADRNVTSWRTSGLDGERAYFYATVPATAGLVINLGEVLVHSWDLAQAIGKQFDVDAELAGLVYGLYNAIPLDDMRAHGHLGPQVAVPDSAPIAERMLGLLGRTP